MYCLDTYALMELAEGNKKFAFLLEEDFVIPSTTLAEFSWVLLREKGEEVKKHWIDKLFGFSQNADVKTMIKAQEFRYSNKKKDLSFFDCVGYIFSLENNSIFVTGDKEFENLKNVKYVKK